MTHKKVIFPDHTLDQMRERGFTRADVRRILAVGRAVPVETFHGEKRHGKVAYTKTSRRRGDAMVVYLEDANRIELVTVMWVE